jgi:hypothetical protein
MLTSIGNVYKTGRYEVAGYEPCRAKIVRTRYFPGGGHAGNLGAK